MAVMFHSRTGSLVTLSNGNRTAQRNQPAQEFNNGMVLSSEPLRDNQLFEVRIDKKINSWSGSIEIGVTTCNPSTIEFPVSATDMREGSWIMSGSSVLRDGRSIVEEYGYDLDRLIEGDRVGVMRTSQGDLHFFVNGINQGLASTNIPYPVYAVIDMYGKCAQVTISNTATDTRMITSEVSNESTIDTCVNNQSTNISTNADKLHFHERCGTLVKLSNNNRTAERRRPLDEFNNGVVMTHRPLKDNELFEIRIDRLVDKWSGSIEVGVTTHNPATLEFPATMTNMRSGTIMMSGCGILTNGKGTRREYGEYNLDELVEGDKIGLMRKSNGNLHYYINNMDQGVAATRVPTIIFGVVDLYGMTVKVTIVDSDDTGDHEIINHCQNKPLLREFQLLSMMSDEISEDDSDKLLFHPRCGNNAAVVCNGRTAHRPNAMEEFDNAVVLTNRPLHVNELFEVVLDKVVPKWAGSIEIGVTTHSPLDLEFPSTMTNIRSGTWIMTGEGILHNGTPVINVYGQNLDWLKAGDRVGVRRKENGALHFYVNGVDQGLAASNIPEKVYGVLDLFGQAVQATMIDQSDQSGASIGNTIAPLSDLRFHHLHGRNADISNGGRTASRPNAYGEFNDSIVISNRPLQDGEMFEVVIEKMVDRWSGSIESEVIHQFSRCCGKNIVLKNNNSTASRLRNFNHGLLFSAFPLENEELFEVRLDQVAKQWSGCLQIGLTTLPVSDTYSVALLPAQASDLTGCDTWLFSGSQLSKNNVVLKDNYGPSLDRLDVGDRMGVKRCSDGSMHIFINSEDFGPALNSIPKKVFAVIDLYGPAETVTITSRCISPKCVDEIPPELNVSTNLNDSCDSLENDGETVPREKTNLAFHENHGRNIQMSNHNLTARRTASYNQGIVVSHKPLIRGQMFQIRIDKLNTRWTSSLLIGVIGQPPEKLYFPVTALGLKKSSWVICNDCVFHNGIKVKGCYGPNLDSLQVKHLVGILIDRENRLHIYVNGVDQGIAAKDIPQNCYAIVDLYGQCEEVSVISGDEVVTQGVEPQYREKADIDNGVREKISRMTITDQAIVKNCEYKNICMRFITSLGVPDGYFNLVGHVCYCETCSKIRGDEPYKKKGDPPKDYTVPFGWCKFGLRIPAKAESVQDKWHVAFHGAKIGEVRKTLDHGELLLPGETGLGSSLRNASQKNKTKDGDGDGSQIFFSPSIRYAGNTLFATRHEFLDCKTKKQHFAQVAFQIFVRPGSYKVGPQRTGAREPVDVHFSNSEIEWFTKERGAIVLHSLLTKIDGL